MTTDIAAGVRIIVERLRQDIDRMGARIRELEDENERLRKRERRERWNG